MAYSCAGAILVAVAALVLGMGLPATAAYIVLAVMTGPALQELGLALITAHMIIFGWRKAQRDPAHCAGGFRGGGGWLHRPCDPLWRQ